MKRSNESPAPRTRTVRKKSRTVIIAVLVLVLAAGCAVGGVAVWQRLRNSAVNVYAVSDIETDYWAEQIDSDGYVETQDLQTVWLSDTQVLEEILVTEGQEVRAGDALFTYDSTLTQLDVDRAELELQQLELELQTAQDELTTIKTYRAGVAVPGSRTWVSYGNDIEEESAETTSDFALTPVSGSGTASDPYVFDWDTVIAYNGSSFDEDTLHELAQGLSDAYAVLRLTSATKSGEVSEDAGNTAGSDDPPESDADADAEEGSADGDEDTPSVSEESTELLSTVTSCSAAGTSTMRLQIQCADGAYTCVILSVTVNGQEVMLSDALAAVEAVENEAAEDETETAVGYYTEGITYTAAELAEMTAEKEQEIKSLQLEIRSAELELQELETELANNTVYSELDGTVILLNDPSTLNSDSDPLMKISAGGSYTITAVLGEMDLGNVSVGQTVEVNVYGDDTVYTTGVIIDISPYPTEDVIYYYSGGNTNISYYPFTVEIDESENLTEGDYAEIWYSWESEADSDSVYILNAFIQSENGQSYVLLYQDGSLKKQAVTTGITLYETYTEITDGVTEEDYLAFPYDSGAEEGTAAEIADVGELYD